MILRPCSRLASWLKSTFHARGEGGDGQTDLHGWRPGQTDPGAGRSQCQWMGVDVYNMRCVPVSIQAGTGQLCDGLPI